MKMYVNSQWTDSPTMVDVVSPYSGEVIDTVPEATGNQIEQALSAAEKASSAMAHLTAYERQQILMRGADLVAAKRGRFGAHHQSRRREAAERIQR